MAIRSKNYKQEIKELTRSEARLEKENTSLRAGLVIVETTASEQRKEIDALKAKLASTEQALGDTKYALKQSDKMYQEKSAELEAVKVNIAKAVIQPKPDAPEAKAPDPAPEAAIPPATTGAA